MKKSKILYLILTAGIIFSALVFTSCGGDGKDRVPFSPSNGEYEIMLDKEEWSEMPGFSSYADSLLLVHSTSGVLITVDYYKISNASEAGISDLDAFIEYFKKLEYDNHPYKTGTDIEAGDLTDVAKKDIKNSVADSGKRQKLSVQFEESSTGNKVGAATEVIYLESPNHYFVIYYSSRSDNFTEAQAGANELINYIETEK